MRKAPPPTTSLPWEGRTKRLVALVTLFLIGLAVWNLFDIIPMLVGSMLLSYLLWPLVNFIEKRILFLLPFRARSLAVVMAFVFVLALFVLVIVLVGPVLVDQISEVGNNIPRLLETAETELSNFLSQPLMIGGNPLIIGGEPVILLDRIQDAAGDSGGDEPVQAEDFDALALLQIFQGTLGSLTAPAFSVLGGAVNTVINLTFLIVIMFYFMRDGEHFVGLIVDLTPESYRGDMRRMLYELGVVWNAYLRGQLVLSVVVGLAVYIAALVLGLPNAPVFGLLSGLLEFIPSLGPFIALVPAALVALVSQSSTLPFLEGVTFFVVVVVVWVLIQNVESYVLVPRIMGGSLNLHPVVVILAVIAGASIAGAIGIILAAPFAASFRLVGQYVYGKIFDTNTFPSHAARRASTPVRSVGAWLQLVNPLRRWRQRRDADANAQSINEEVF